MNQQFHMDTLPSNTALLVNQFQEESPKFLHNFYLSGGTALSLQLGHRESEDLDFFSQDNFDPRIIQVSLEKFGKLSNLELAQGTLNTFLNGVKLQFLEYPYDLLEPHIDWHGLKISSVIDIACTKLQTVSARGSKKDFIDLFFLLQKYSLEFLFENLEKKYLQSNFNKVHILKSLVYFVDADEQPSPRMHINIYWEKIKEEIINKVNLFKI